MSRRSREAELEVTTTPESGSRSAAALAIGIGRLAVGVVFLANPVLSVRLLGVDSATAARLDWLARMAAARDAAIGLGTVASSRTGRGVNAWLLAGAACDAADAAVLSNALLRKRVATVPAAAVALSALAGTAVALRAVRAPRATAGRQVS
jgi:hypothetical protein